MKLIFLYGICKNLVIKEGINLQEKEDIEQIKTVKNETPEEIKKENRNLNEEKAKTKENIKQIKKQQNNKRIRRIVVIIFIVLFAITSCVVMRGNYLEYKELGEQYVQELLTNYKVKYSVMAIIFVFLYFLIYVTNRGIKKGLREFFDREKIEMPKLPNKSLALSNN